MTDGATHGGFEVFDRGAHGRGRRDPTALWVSIGKDGGRVSLSGGALKALGDPTHLVALFISESSVIAFRAGDDDPNRWKINRPKAARAGIVRLPGFGTAAGLKPEAIGRRWPARMEGDLLVVELGGEGDE